MCLPQWVCVFVRRGLLVVVVLLLLLLLLVMMMVFDVVLLLVSVLTALNCTAAQALAHTRRLIFPLSQFSLLVFFSCVCPSPYRRTVDRCSSVQQ